jgi:sugar lactone lactonase YvrE
MTRTVYLVAATLLAAGGVALIPRRRNVAALLTAIGLVAIAAAMPAFGAFTSNPSGHTHPTPTLPINAATLPTMALGSPTCQWAGANVQVNVTPLSSTYSSIVQNVFLQRSANGGAYSDNTSSSTYNVASLTDTSASSPQSNTYTYKVNARSGTNWVGPYSSTVTSDTCVNRVTPPYAGITTAAIHTTNGVAVDSSGNVAFTDTGGHRVAYVPAASGTYFGVAMFAGYLYAIAGTGTAGFSGDGAAGTSAKVNAPEGIAFDANGNVYFADTANHVVRVINKSTASASFFGAGAITAGQIQTVAGTGTSSGNTGDGAVATSAKLSSPRGVGFDSTGDLIISDTGNNRLRMVPADNSNHYSASPAMNHSNYIWNLAGSSAGSSGSTNDTPATSASFNGPQQFLLDSSNNIYVADTGNDIVRKIPIAAATATATIAGQAGSAGTTGDGTAATSAKLSATTTAVAVDSNNTVYIADAGSSNVRAVCQTVAGCSVFGKGVSNGNIESVVGTGTNGFTGEGYPVQIGSSTTSKLSAPKGVYFDRTGGNLYIADTSNQMIRKVVNDTTTGQFTSGVNYLVAVAGNGTSGWTDQVPAAGAGLVAPEAIAADTNGNIFIADKGDNRVREYVANINSVVTIMGTGASGASGDGAASILAKLNAPEGIAVDANGVVYVADTGNNKVRAICPYGGSTCSVLNVSVGAGLPQVVAGGALTAGTCADGVSATLSTCKLNSPKGLEVNSAGDLYIADTQNSSIKWVPNANSATNNYGKGAVTKFLMYNIASPASSVPNDVAVDSSRNVYLADASAVRIKQIAWSNGASTNIAGTGSAGHTGDGGAATSAQISAAVTGIAIDGSTIYLADNQLYVRRFAVGGDMYAVGGTGSGGNSGDYAGATAAAMVPFGIGVYNNDIYFAGGTTTNIQFRKITGPAAWDES